MSARRTGHAKLAAACLVGALAALLPAVLAAYAERALLNADQFANRATAALQDEDVRTVVAAEVTDELVLANARDLLTARPLIQSVTSDVVGGAAFGRLFRAAVLDLHRAAFERDLDTVTLTVADAGTVVGAALEQARPSLAARIREDERLTLLRRDVDAGAAELARFADRVELLAPLLAAIAVALAAAGIAVSADRRRAAGRLGIGTAVVGIAIVLGYTIARAIALDQVNGAEDRAAAGAIWDAFLADLRTAGWVLAGSGAVVAAAASSLLRPVDIEPALGRLRRWIATEPTSTPLRAVRGIALIAAGALVVARPAAALELLATLAGVYLIYAGAQMLLRLVYRPDRPREAPAARRAIGRRAAVAGIAALVIAGAWTAFAASGGTSEPAPAVAGCNGHRELCDVPLDRVVLAATHNAMSSPSPGWYSSQQDAGIAEQLEDGIRALLIDTHYGDRLRNGRIRTDLGDAPRRVASEDAVSEEAFAAALRIRERIGFGGEGERGMYLCHSFCELGAKPLKPALDAIHDFLVTHPGEIVVVINQDYVAPADFVAAVEDAGLAELAAVPPAGDRWPTLGEMVEDDRRLVVLAENEAGAAPWYQLVYERLTEETPFAFGEPAQLTDRAALPASCARNRGPSGAPLFLVNHWITTDPAPRPSNAAVVNAREPLLRRARACSRLRDHVPNLLAVDFYRQGDLFAVVDELNGVS